MAEQESPRQPDERLPGPDRLAQDPLSGLPNEQLFHLRFPAEFGLAREHESNGALLAMRLDDVVAINDRYGRAGGDDALRAVGYILSNVRAAPGRETHAAFRLGGPLFGYFIPACSAPEARAVAEEIHDIVQRSEIFLQRITVSIGIVNFYELFMEDGSREQLALRAEQVALSRLGVAERRGANTICDSTESPTTTVTAGRTTVLLADPEPAAMELLVRAMEAAELVVEIRENGEDALAFVQVSPPALIICEAMLPRLDGFTVRERLRTNALWNAIPFILVSHRKTDELVRKAVERDIRHFFRKPVSLTEVTGLVVNIARSAAR
jgi:diguanylate cyclase (GGDEF)-like protein